MQSQNQQPQSANPQQPIPQQPDPSPAQPGQGDDFTKPGKIDEQAAVNLRPSDDPIEHQADDRVFEINEEVENDDASAD